MSTTTKRKTYSNDVHAKIISQLRNNALLAIYWPLHNKKIHREHLQANEYHIVLCIAGPYHTTHMSLTSRLHVRNITRVITDKYALIHFEQDFIISMDSFNMLTEITANNQRLYYLTFVTNTLEEALRGYNLFEVSSRQIQ